MQYLTDGAWRDASKERYSEYLQSDHWLSLRTQKLVLVHRQCQCCSIGGRLQVHHRNYRDWYDCTVDDLIVLCAKCHKLFHDAMRINRTRPHHYTEAESIELIKRYVQRNQPERPQKKIFVGPGQRSRWRVIAGQLKIILRKGHASNASIDKAIVYLQSMKSRDKNVETFGH